MRMLTTVLVLFCLTGTLFAQNAPKRAASKPAAPKTSKEPVISRQFALQNKAEEIAPVLRAIFRDANVGIVVVAADNSIVVVAPPELMKDIGDLIEQVDSVGQAAPKPAASKAEKQPDVIKQFILKSAKAGDAAVTIKKFYGKRIGDVKDSRSTTPSSSRRRRS
jgi:hypothetical protein